MGGIESNWFDATHYSSEEKMQSEVLVDFEAAEKNFIALMDKYSAELKAELAKHGGQLSDVPAQADHPFWKLQNKVMTANHMYKDGLLVEPVVEKKIESLPEKVDKPITVSHGKPPIDLPNPFFHQGKVDPLQSVHSLPKQIVHNPGDKPIDFSLDPLPQTEKK
jgi:hypothetical protein